MKKTLVAGSVGLALLALAGSANALTFNEAQGQSFAQLFAVTPSATDRLVFSVSGMTSQLDSLSFSFLSGPSVTASHPVGQPTVWLAAFNDIRNTGFSLAGGTPYQVTISGHTAASIPGGEAAVSVNILNGIISSVPEPEGYAMLLAGLGLLGMIGRRGISADK